MALPIGDSLDNDHVCHSFPQSMDVHFNEEFRFERPTQLKEEFKEALVKGLPFPILTVVE